MKIAVSTEGIFFLTRFAFHHSGVGGSYVFFFFFFYRTYPQPNVMGYVSPQKQFGPFSLKERLEKWLFFFEKSNYHRSHLSNPLVKLLLEGSVYNKCLVSGILQFHRPWQLGMKSGGIMSIVNEYAIYILIKLCTSGVKECRFGAPQLFCLYHCCLFK